MKLNKINPSAPGDQKSYATLYAPFDLTISDSQTKAYYITEVTEGKAKLIETTDIPKLTAVVLINSEGNANAGFNVTTNRSSVVSADDNLLKGTLVPLTIDLTDNTPYYSLGRRREDSTSPYVVGFYKANNSAYTLGANRAYLDMTGVQTLASGYVFSFDEGETTKIGEVIEVNNVNDNAWYTLDGRKLNGQPTSKGLYIVNGKKMIVK